MYKKNYFVSNNDVDLDFNLKISAIFRYFQDVALAATRDAALDPVSLSKRNIDWVIIRMAVEIKRLPTVDDEIEVITYPGKNIPMLFPRYFFIKDKQGNVLIRASSIWALIDNITRKAIIDRDAVSRLPEEHHDGELDLPEKIAIPDNMSLLENRKIHYSDLDFNGHMNNVRYVELLMDGNDSSFYKNHKPIFVTLNYMKEIKEKETVSVYSNLSNPQVITVHSNDTISFVGKITFSD